MIQGLSVGVLDEKKGPSAIFTLDLDEELSNKLVFKVKVGVMSFSDKANENDL